MRAGFIIFSLISLVLLAVAGWYLKDTLDLRSGAEVEGRIASFVTHADSDGTTYTPVYEFEFDGETRTHKRSFASSGRPEVGERLTLFVDPDDPSRVKPDTFMGQWFLPVLLGGIGAFLGLFALAFGVGALGERARRRLAAHPMATSADIAAAVRADAKPGRPTEVDYDGPFR